VIAVPSHCIWSMFYITSPSAAPYSPPKIFGDGVTLRTPFVSVVHLKVTL